MDSTSVLLNVMMATLYLVMVAQMPARLKFFGFATEALRLHQINVSKQSNPKL